MRQREDYPYHGPPATYANNGRFYDLARLKPIVAKPSKIYWLIIRSMVCIGKI